MTTDCGLRANQNKQRITDFNARAKHEPLSDRYQSLALCSFVALFGDLAEPETVSTNQPVNDLPGAFWFCLR